MIETMKEFERMQLASETVKNIQAIEGFPFDLGVPQEMTLVIFNALKNWEERA